MASGNVTRILRTPGRLVVNPSEPFLDGVFPYGGIEIGLVRQCMFQPLGRSKRIRDEGLGETVEVLEAPNEWIFTCYLRGWDNDAVEQFFRGGWGVGENTGHSMFAAPGDRSPGQGSSAEIDISLAFVPDNPLDQPGAMIYRGIPMWSEDAELTFARGEEFGIPLQVDCLRNAAGNILAIGRMPDLRLS